MNNLTITQVGEFKDLIQNKITELIKVKQIMVEPEVASNLVKHLEKVNTVLSVFDNSKAVAGVYVDNSIEFLDDLLNASDYYIKNPQQSIVTFKNEIQNNYNPITMAPVMKEYYRREVTENESNK